MLISATLNNSYQSNEIILSTDGNEKNLLIPPKPTGFGSSVNGGELLMLALATCFCNDIYREAAKRKLNVKSVEVRVSGSFAKEAEPGTEISYQVWVEAPDHSANEINDLIIYVDEIAEIHNTIRSGTPVIIKQL